MLRILPELLPLAFGAAISPVALTMTVLILAQRTKPLANAIAFAIGEAIPLVAIGLPGMLIGHAMLRARSHSGGKISAWMDVGFGVILGALAIVQIVRRPKSGESTADADNASDAGAGDDSQPKAKGFLRYVLTGIGMMFVNFSTIMIFIPAVKVIAGAHLNLASRLASFVILMAITMSLTIVPIVLYAVAPTKAARILTPIGDWFKAHTHQITIGLLIVFSLYLLVKGFRAL